MKAVIVAGVGQAPAYADFADPVPTEGNAHVTVTAAAISPIVRSRASGAHYSASAAFPFVVGIDGVGRLDDGTRVYFVLPQAPHGSMAERTLVPAARCLPLPADLDDVTAAAIANPGMSSMAAFTYRARLQPGETVLINGATGAAGRLAVQIAKHLGAGRIIATGRNAETLAALGALGADVTIPLAAGSLDAKLEQVFADGIDVVLDYLWGPSAERLLAAAAKKGATAVPIRFVQIGAASGASIAMPSALLRSTAIELMGSGIGSVSLDNMVAATAELLNMAGSAGLEIAASPAPLADVARVWALDAAAGRTVLIPDPPRA